MPRLHPKEPIILSRVATNQRWRLSSRHFVPHPSFCEGLSTAGLFLVHRLAQLLIT